MQYPQIQFYKGSLVRLASGQLKQVEDLSSDDFIESARLAASTAAATRLPNGKAPQMSSNYSSDPMNNSTWSLNNAGNNSQSQHRNRFHFHANVHQQNPLYRNGGSSGTLDENNNSVFNSPEPTSASYDDSPQMDTEGYDDDHDNDHDDDEEVDVELDVVTNDEQEPPTGAKQLGLGAGGPGASMRSLQQVSELVGSGATFSKQPLDDKSRLGKRDDNRLGASDSLGSFYIDSSVVRDFLEVGPIQQQMANNANVPPPLSSSPASSTGSLTNQDQQHIYSMPSTSASSSSSNSLQLAPNSTTPPAAMPQITSAAPATASPTVLIKFFLETTRSIAFIEVPIEHPFFVLHRGWSSWNPQMTYETFGLKCRKLKIGDTCISLIRRRKRTNSHHDSDQCNILFSSIKINE